MSYLAVKSAFFQVFSFFDTMLRRLFLKTSSGYFDRRYAGTILQMLGDSPAFVCCSCFPNGELVFTNQVAQKFIEDSGYAANRFQNFTEATLGLTYTQLMQECVEKAKPVIISELPLALPSGEMSYWDFRCSVFYDRRGTVGGLFHFGVDVTKQVLARKRSEETERRYKLALDTAQLGTWEYRRASQEVIWNEYHEQIFGYQPGRSVRPITDFVKRLHPEDRDRVIAQAEFSQTNKVPFNMMYRVCLPSGDTHWIAAHGRVYGSGEAERFVGVVRDVTAAHKSDLALRKSEAQFRELANSMPQIIWTALPDGQIDYCNDLLLKSLGCESSANIAQAWKSVIYSEDQDRVTHTWQQCLETGENFHLEFRFWSEQFNEYRWHLGNAIMSRDEFGTPMKWYGSCTDIHDQKLVQLELMRSREEFRAMGETIPYGVWMCSANGEPLHVSESFLKFLNLDFEQYKAGLWHRLIAPAQLNAILTQWYDCLRTGEPWEVEVCVRGADGVDHYVLSRGRPVRDEHGNILRWVGINLDIDDRKRIEQSLEAAVRARDNFLSVASHELKTPLTSLDLQAQLYAKSLSTGAELSRERVEKLVSMTSKQVGRLTRLVNDMLDIARIESGKLAISTEYVPLAQIVRDVVERSAPQLNAANCSIDVDVDADLICCCDPFRFDQVLTNLIINAARYAPGSKVSLRAEMVPERKFLRIIVEDAGPGISSENLEKIFGRFERIASDRKVSGLGLGLYISRKIIEAHRGRIWAENAPSQGVRFIIELPNERKSLEEVKTV